MDTRDLFAAYSVNPILAPKEAIIKPYAGQALPQFRVWDVLLCTYVQILSTIARKHYSMHTLYRASSARMEAVASRHGNQTE